MKYITRSKRERELYDEMWCPWYECPNCENQNLTPGFKYCPDCGERIVFKGKPEDES